MKNYKKGLLVIAALSAMSLMAVESKTIQVTTFEDEDGENPSQCSLREAIRTAYENKSYGGCTVGNTLLNIEDDIQLEAGEYKLNKEIIIHSPVRLYGALPYDSNKKSDFLGVYPAQLPLKTVINAQNNSRIFNTGAKGMSLEINNVLLKNGRAKKTTEDKGNGGALYIGGRLTLFNSDIINSEADAEGGAIYFTGKVNNASLDIENGLFQGNKAKNGAMFAMDCHFNLEPLVVDVQWLKLSIIENGDAASQSIVDLCGAPTVEWMASTIAKNTVGTPNHAGVIRMVSEVSADPTQAGVLKEVHRAASLSLKSNTIVENSGTTFSYDNLGSKTLASNIIAFNLSGGNVCHYALNKGVPEANQNITLIAANNAFAESCTLPDTAFAVSNQNRILTNEQRSALLSSLKAASVYNNYLPLYYPLNLSSSADFVDMGHSGCSEFDQRGIERVTDATLLFDPSAQNSCDIGAVELMRLTAADIVDLKNKSYLELVQAYEDDIAQFKEMLKDPENKDQLDQIKEELAIDESTLEAFKKHRKYRGIYIDPFVLALPDEVGDARTGELRLKSLNTEHYKISTKVLGVGQLKEVSNGVANISGNNNDPDLKCEWQPDMKRIMLYRTNRQITNSTDTEYCSYTITDKETGVASTGLISAVFNNLAPIAKDDTYRISPKTGLKVTVNPLENDNDDADGPTDSLTVKPESKYFINIHGEETPIRFESRDSGLNISAEREGPCPDTHLSDTCYGGKITFEVKNSLSQFDYRVVYNVFDADGGISNDATILLKNDVINTSTSSSGGGSFGVFGIFGVLTLALYRRYRR